ncbi:MAG TPA: hypothetical protein VGM88_17435 [Kofleriaceae bacterium]|jgi:hypothetical protein
MRWAVALGVCAACGKAPHEKRSFDASSVAYVPVVADAAGGKVSDEIEPNDGEDVATPLALGQTVRGSIASDTDVDEYRIDVTAAGALAVALSGVDGMDLTLELEDASGNGLAKSDRAGARGREGVPNFGVTPGRYTAVVRAKKKKPAKAGSGSSAAPPVYEITASVAPVPAATEREPDDDRAAANDLLVGDTVSGFVGWSGDADVYKLSVETLSAKNAIDLEVSPVEGIAPELEVSDAVGAVLLSRKGARGQPLVVRGLVPVIAPGAAPFEYVTVKADRSNPETAYQLRVTAHVLAPDAEQEPDDTLETAMPVPVDRTVVRASFTTGDVDCFAFAPSDAARSLDITIDTPADIDLAAELFVDGKSVAKADHPGKGAAERVSGDVPAGGKPIACVRGAAKDGAGDSAYSVTIAERAAAPP